MNRAEIIDLLIIYPFIPAGMMLFTLFCKTVFKKDISIFTTNLSVIVQYFMGGSIFLFFFNNPSKLVFPLNGFFGSITLMFDTYKLFFLAAYMATTSIVLISGHINESFRNYQERILLLLFFTGCSGIIVSGDMFNFFVYYELMIICAYVLIGSNKKYSASLKYMIFGALSSIFLLSGIIVNYLYTGMLSFPGDYSMPVLACIFFILSFMLKSAIFPFSWVSTCHSAARVGFSAMLSSFTLITGIFGLYYLALPGLRSNGMILNDILIIAYLSSLISAWNVFKAVKIKKMIAWSSVYAVSNAIILLMHGQIFYSFVYISAHSIYKTVMFLVCRTDHRLSKVLFNLCVMTAGGVFPFMIFLLKAHHNVFEESLLIIGSFLVMAGLFRVVPKGDVRLTDNATWVFLMFLILNISLFFFSTRFIDFKAQLVDYNSFISRIYISFVILGVSWLTAKNRRAQVLYKETKEFPMRSLNRELAVSIIMFLILILTFGR